MLRVNETGNEKQEADDSRGSFNLARRNLAVIRVFSDWRQDKKAEAG